MEDGWVGGWVWMDMRGSLASGKIVAPRSPEKKKKKKKTFQFQGPGLATPNMNSPTPVQRYANCESKVASRLVGTLD